MRVTLKVVEGPHLGQSFSFAGHDTFLVGRSKRAHFRLPTKDRYFSRIHFLVEVNPPFCRLLDMGSRNGTHVNGERVARAVLKHGDQIRAGKSVLRVSVEESLSGASLERVDPDSTPTLPPVVRATSAPGTRADDVPSVVSRPPAAAPAPPPASALARASLSRSMAAIVPPPMGTPPEAAPPVAAPAGPAASSVMTTLPSTCCACGNALTSAPTGSLTLCSTCEQQSRSLPQSIPGYSMVRKLGQGAMGVVYLAVSKKDSQRVALKAVTPAVAGSPGQVQRFLREADILRQLQHPNIVGFRDLGEAHGVLYFAMDHVIGHDACKLLRREGPLPIGRAVTLGCQLLDALAYAHARGFVHRDIKPSNLLVTENQGRELVKVVDFGLARVYQASQLSGLTLTGEIGGTMAFIPPEQITAYREARPAADQFASAATIYNLLTGKFIHDLPNEFHKQILVILQDDPVPLEKRRRAVPAALSAALHRALARDPDDRYPDVAAFRTALLPFCG